MTPSEVQAMASTLRHDLVEKETVETRIGSGKVGNVQGEVDALSTPRASARYAEDTSIVVLDDEDDEAV